MHSNTFSETMKRVHPRRIEAPSTGFVRMPSHEIYHILILYDYQRSHATQAGRPCDRTWRSATLHRAGPGHAEVRREQAQKLRSKASPRHRHNVIHSKIHTATQPRPENATTTRPHINHGTSKAKGPTSYYHTLLRYTYSSCPSLVHRVSGRSPSGARDRAPEERGGSPEQHRQLQ